MSYDRIIFNIGVHIPGNMVFILKQGYVLYGKRKWVVVSMNCSVILKAAVLKMNGASGNLRISAKA